MDQNVEERDCQEHGVVETRNLWGQVNHALLFEHVNGMERHRLNSSVLFLCIFFSLLALYLKMSKETVILYPAPGIGHLVSMVELGKLILLHNPNFFIIVLITSMPSQQESTYSSYIKQISETNTLISFYYLPSLSFSPNDPNHQNPISLAFEFMRLNVPNVISALETISSSSSSVLALITSAISTEGSYHPKIPTYHYYTSCATTLAFMLYFPTLDSQISPRSFRDLGSSPIHIPGLPLPPIIQACHVPEPLLDRNQGSYDEFLKFATCLPKADGIILNTFDSLETKAIEAISHAIPASLYCIGPIIADARGRSCSVSVSRNASSDTDCLSWLDKQPIRSAVFLCFGSRGSFSKTQMKQIAIGLERSGQRFLWVVKSPLGNKSSKYREELDIEKLLPHGFLERTKDRGLVVKSWAPQALVLSHEAVGGFVTHCGWNSVLEAVSAGVPMATWPLYAEQKMNSVVLVVEMKIAIAILNHQADEHELVSSDEVEEGVRRLMSSSEEGEALRKRSLEMKGMAQAAWKSRGGSSFDAFFKLVGSWKHNDTS